MVDPLTLSLIFSAGSTVFRGGLGAVQAARARKLAERNRPNYEVPKSAIANQRLAQTAFNAASAYGLPGQSAIENRMAETQAGSLRSVRDSQMSPSAILAGVSSIDKNSRDANANLGVQAANFREQNMRATRSTLMGANGVLAGYEDRAFNYNKDAPYQAAMRASSALRNASQNNAMMAIDQGLGNLAGFAARGGFGGAPVDAGAGGAAVDTSGTFGRPQGNNMNMLNSYSGMSGYGTTPSFQGDYISQLIEMKRNNPWMSENDLMNMVQQANPGYAPINIPNEKY